MRNAGYKVLVLAVEESHVSRRLQELLKDENNQLKVDDATKIVGCWKALSKQGLSKNLPEIPICGVNFRHHMQAMNR